MDRIDHDVKITKEEITQPKSLKRKKTTPLTLWVTSSFDGFETDLKSESKTSRRHGKADSEPSAIISTQPYDSNDLLFDQYRPTKRTDLCVHVRKVAEVDNWLKNALSGPIGIPRILLITGPSGCGKTATLRCLCSQRNIELREWSNPVGGNEMEKLEQFLFRSDRYTTDLTMNNDESRNESSNGTVVLIEELPPSVGDQPELLRKLLERHARGGRIPLVLILSDSSSREFSPLYLLPKTVLTELHIDTIRFNPIAPTQMKKALQRVADNEGRKRRGRARYINSSALAELVTECGGDIRCALNRMQFILTHSASKSKKNNTKNDDGNEETNTRDSCLCLFRSLGKVLHCKRASSNEKSSNLPLPPHLSIHQRDPLSFNPEDVFERSRLPGSLFSTFLQENCPDFFADITELSNALDTFSLADRIGAVWSADRTPGTQLADLYVGGLTARGIAFNKQHAKAVGFRPMRRPMLLSLPKLFRGTENRPLLLDIQPYRRILRNKGQLCRLARSTRFGGSLTENDTAYQGELQNSMRTMSRVPEDAEMQWTIVTTEDDNVVIDDPDS